MTKKKIEIQIMDDPDHEDLIAEVLYGEEFFLLFSQEDGWENLDIQIQTRKSNQPWSLTVAELETIIERVKKRLWDLRRT